MTRLGGVLAAACLTAACGTPLMTLPQGPGAPAVDAVPALISATERCRAIQSLSLVLSISGRVGGERLRARMLAGLSAPASVFLDVPAPFGASVFMLGAVGEHATLLLPRDRRVLTEARPAEMLEAITGVYLDAGDLRRTLTGCVDTDGAATGHAIGDNWRVVSAANDAYLRRERADAPWRLVAVVHRPAGRAVWRAEYHDFDGALPRTVRLVSDAEGRFDLRLSLSQLEIDAALPPSTFQVVVPAGFDPLTIEDLRRAGPLAEPESR